VIVAGTTTLFDASSFVSGSAPPTETLSCNDTWTGGGASAEWSSAANWTTGVPNGTGVDVCLPGNANVLLSDSSFAIGELTVSAGSSLTIGSPTATTATGTGTGTATTATSTTATTTAGLTVSSGLQNDGSLTVDPSGTTGDPALTLDGPIMNTGTLTVNGTVGIGDAVSTALSNDGTIGVAPGGLINVDGSSSITNEPDGLMAFGIDGPPSSVTAYGRITNGTLSLAGSADPVFENGFVPSAGAEYFVVSGTASGAFTTVLHGASADYSHTGEVGLVGGAPATSTSTSVSSSVAAGSRFGQSVQFTAAVVPGSGTDPTGSVSFFANGLPLGSSPVATTATGATAAALEVSSLPVGSQSITAAYGGDVVFDSSTSPAATQVVSPDPTNLTITPSSASPEPGQPIVDTATVSPAIAGTATPTGTVSFTDDGSPVTGCQSLSLPAVAPLQVSCTETYGSGATHSVEASYSGDEDDAGSNASLLQVVGQVPTETTIASSSPTSTYGQSVALRATVTTTATAGVDPTGTVTFYDYQTNPIATVGASTVDGTTTASLNVSSLMGGLHSITATYNGDQTFGSSSSDAPVHLDVAEAPTIVTVASSADSTIVGQPVVFTVTINSSAAGETGTVQFVDNGLMIGSGTVSGGQATFETESLTLGAHPMTAVYEGDDDFVGSSSTNTVIQTIDQASSSTEVSSSHDPVLVGQAVAYTATVGVDAPGSGTPTGSVSFSDGGSPIPTCQGLALPPGPPLSVTCSQAYDTNVGRRITATYSGDADFSTSTGAMAETVSPVSTSTTVVSSPSASTSGQSVTLTATVAPTSGTAIPDGTVTFSANGTALGSSTLSNTDGVTTASMLLTTLPVGSDPVIASYGGGAGFLASSSTSAATVAVSRASTTLGLLGSANPSVPGQSVTLTATVFPTTGSGETGTVRFFDNGTRIGLATVSNAQATLTVSTLPAGDDSISAVYSGDGNFVGSSTTVPLSQQVGRRI
jgi:large repetitive protein